MKHSVKILLVEDHPIAQMAAKFNLEEAGCTVEIASSGKEALEKALQSSYDIIFMDIGLEEGTDGFIVTEEIKKLSSQNQLTPIIALTAHDNIAYQEKSKKAGMTSFLTKPIETEQVIKIIIDLNLSETNHKNDREVI